MTFSLTEFGDDARLVRFSPSPGARVLSGLRGFLLAGFPEWDVAVGDGCLLVVGEEVEARLSESLSKFREGEVVDAVRTHEIPVVYDGADLDECATALGLPRSRLIELHTRPAYRVEFPGFLPGFAYLRGLLPELRLPRRSTPRSRVLAGSVAIAAEYSAIYPHDSPGGWHLLGRSLGPRPFEAERVPPVLFEVGDEVRFVPAAPEASASVVVRRRAEPLGARSGIVIERAPPGTTLQDAGREGFLGLGLPPSGPLDPETYRAACCAVASPGSAAIEVPSGEFRLRARGALLCSVDGARAKRLVDGEVLAFEVRDRNVSYVAARGGFSGDEAFGSRSTHLLARLGGHLGRGVRAGDEIPLAAVKSLESVGELRSTPTVNAEDAAVTMLAIDRGPDFALFPREEQERFLESVWRVGRLGDRTGRRLVGPPLKRANFGAQPSFPMRRGAIQIASDGTPIVLGPDHPTTGGYPVIARLRPESWGALARLRADAPLRFVFRNIRE